MAIHSLRVSIREQRLTLLNEQAQVMRDYPVSTARNGPGEQRDSGCTPRGWHAVRAVIGYGLPENTVFRARRPTGEYYDAELEARYPGRDWILGRILWLGGLEPGVNRYGHVDTGSRYIYIHGAPERGVDGTPQSHGCIRMRCHDVVELAGMIRAGLRVQVN